MYMFVLSITLHYIYIYYVYIHDRVTRAGPTRATDGGSSRQNTIC